MPEPKDLRPVVRASDAARRTLVPSTEEAPRRLGERGPLRPRGDADSEVGTPGIVAPLRPVAPVARPRYILLNPGPVLTSPGVKGALDVDVTHRDADFVALLARLQDRLCRVFRAPPDRYSTLLLTGSGTGAAEATLSTFVPRGKKVLVVQNGAFGERMQEIAAIHGVDAPPLRYPWGEAVAPADVEARLAADPDLWAVAMVHHETSVGVLNPVRAVGEVAARHGRLFFLDCISSLGGEDLDVERDLVDVAIACGNKCLHGVAGLAFVCVKRALWPLVADEAPRSVYLDLRRYHQYQEGLGQTPFTPAVGAAYALDEALRELLDTGLDARVAHYRSLCALVRAGLRELGLVVENAHERGSHTLSCVTLPAGLEFEALYGALKARGFIVYNGKGEQAGRMFQVANMGALTEAHVQDFLEALREVLGALGAPLPFPGSPRPSAESKHG